jgi:colicin import membrane protein
MLRLCVILRRRGQALAAMDPLKYEVLRDEHGRAVENEQQRRAKEAADLAARQAEQERIKAQARREPALEKARGFDGQKAGYDQRQREEAASQKREANRTAYLKVNDPPEYARQERDKQIKDQRTADERGFISRWEQQQRTQAQKPPQREIPGREQTEKSRENGDVAERKEPNKYWREMSEQTREAIDKVRENDEREHTRERERSGR